MTRRFLLVAIPLLGLTFPATAKEPVSIRRAIHDEMRRYPDMEIQDLYKFCYQAAMGNEHIMTDTAAARQYLLSEMESVKPDRREPLIEALTNDSAVVRVNLRPYKARNGSVDALLTAMARTATTFRKSTDVLRTFWAEVMSLAGERQIHFVPSKLEEYFAAQEQAAFPAVDHSEHYLTKYTPAYRVILRRFLTL